MKCANCLNDALYEYKITMGASVFYCNKDLPKFLKERKLAGVLTVTEKHDEDLKDALSVLAVVPSAPEVVVEEEKPVKKAPKKKAK